jgi:hypothetical protein
MTRARTRHLELKAVLNTNGALRQSPPQNIVRVGGAPLNVIELCRAGDAVCVPFDGARQTGRPGGAARLGTANNFDF